MPRRPLRPVLEFEAQRAREYYRSAEELLPLIDEDSQPALWTLVEIYRRLLERIAARNYDVFSERVRLSSRRENPRPGEGIRAPADMSSANNNREADRRHHRRRPGGYLRRKRAGRCRLPCRTVRAATLSRRTRLVV